MTLSAWHPPSGPHSAGQGSCDLAESRHLEEEVALGKMCKDSDTTVLLE